MLSVPVPTQNPEFQMSRGADRASTARRSSRWRVLLSSLFVYNQMGGIDEAALDRLSLVTEMTKHIRVKAGGAAGALCADRHQSSVIWLAGRPAAVSCPVSTDCDGQFCHDPSGGMVGCVPFCCFARKGSAPLLGSGLTPWGANLNDD